LLAPLLSRLTGPPVIPLSSHALARQFLNKTAALSLYRSFIRATRGLGDLRARQETVAWVRDDFEKYRHEVESVSSYNWMRHVQQCAELT
jgi:hypothetical protein